jgi:hypothetical protein
MSKFIIAVSSCKSDADGAHNAVIRRTWGKLADGLGIPYFFNVGGHTDESLVHNALTKEIRTNCPDSYEALGHKTIWNVQHALRGGYTHMFQCFTDTYISIPRLIEAYKFVEGANPALVGNFRFLGYATDHACGGSGYWLNREAMEAVASWKWNQDYYVARHQAEDQLVSAIVSDLKLPYVHDLRYDHESKRGGVRPDNDNITNHLSAFGHRYTPGWMLDEFRQEQTGIPSRRG